MIPWLRQAPQAQDPPTHIPGLINWFERAPEPYQRRARVALDAIRLGTEGRLRLASMFSIDNSTEAYIPSDAKIVRAALRALKGQTRSAS